MSLSWVLPGKGAEAMAMEPSPVADIPAACLQCRGCIDCDEAHCPFHARGDPLDCRRDRCTYCTDFLKRQRLYMNNVG